MIEIVPFAPHHEAGVVAVILPIQQSEFAIPITLDAQPDLRDVPGFYQRGHGNFWVAVHEGTVVGTVGLLDIGDGRAALRKMFVSASHRGPAHGVARRLLDALLAWCHAHAVREIYLGTTAKFLAAHRFYEKNGFREIPRADLPESFPVMVVDTKFYFRALRAPGALDLMRLHVEALYVHDARSRITSTNEWKGKVAPRFFFGRTIAGNLWRFRADLPEDLTLALEDLCNDEPVANELPRTPLRQEELIRLLERHLPIERIWAGPAYWFSGRIAPSPRSVEVNAANADLLRGGLEDWIEDVPHLQPFRGVIEEGRVVSLCASVRITDAAHAAGVETLPAFRRRGHAADVVASWADAVRRIGAMPLYSTAWDNTASRNLAASLGLSPFGVDFHVT